MSAESEAEYEAEIARIHAKHAAAIRKIEIATESALARIQNQYTNLAPGQTNNAKQEALRKQIANIQASHVPEPGSQGGRHKRVHKRVHKRTHKRAHKR